MCSRAERFFFAWDNMRHDLASYRLSQAQGRTHTPNPDFAATAKETWFDFNEPGGTPLPWPFQGLRPAQTAATTAAGLALRSGLNAPSATSGTEPRGRVRDHSFLGLAQAHQRTHDQMDEAEGDDWDYRRERRVIGNAGHDFGAAGYFCE